MSCHCWADPLDLSEFGSEEYLDWAVEREFGRTYTCWLPADHAGPHEWTLDEEMRIDFNHFGVASGHRDIAAREGAER